MARTWLCHKAGNKLFNVFALSLLFSSLPQQDACEALNTIQELLATTSTPCNTEHTTHERALLCQQEVAIASRAHCHAHQLVSKQCHPIHVHASCGWQTHSSKQLVHPHGHGLIVLHPWMEASPVCSPDYLSVIVPWRHILDAPQHFDLQHRFTGVHTCIFSCLSTHMHSCLHLFHAYMHPCLPVCFHACPHARPVSFCVCTLVSWHAAFEDGLQKHYSAKMAKTRSA